MTFRDLRIGQSFDWINPDGMYNSFYRPCWKTSARTYVDDQGQNYRVGSINAKVYHVDKYGSVKSNPPSRCECSDPGCPAHKGKSRCPDKATVTLRRIDFAGTPKVKMCADCAADALDSGVFG